MSHLYVPAHLGIRSTTRKLVFYYGLPLHTTNSVDIITPAGIELYDLEKDPLETKNVYDDPEYAEDACRMRKLLSKVKCEVGDIDTDEEFLKRYHEYVDFDNN